MRNTLRMIVYFLLTTLVVGLVIFSGSLQLFTKTANYALAVQTKTLVLLIKKEKTTKEIQYVNQVVVVFRNRAVLLAKMANNTAGLIPLSKLKSVARSIDSAAVFSTQLENLLGSSKEANYILFFLNNYELRPGGGFIGSIGKVTIKNYTLTRFEIEDVYEIDGQVTEHHEPHYAVRKYLNQPDEFLRDSNFSPDFRTNVKNALSYFEYIPKYNIQYDGAIGITVSAFEQLLDETGPIYIPDYNLTIDSSNFFEETQSQIEGDFFPGSNQKKNILSSLSTLTIARLEKLPPLKFLSFVYQSLSSKNIVLYAKTDQLEDIFNNFNWSGAQKAPVRDYILPIDTNVGVNKVNKYIETAIELQIIHTPPRQQRIYKAAYTNNSNKNTLFAGTYKNYFQLYTPSDTQLKNVAVDGVSHVSEVIKTNENGYRVYGLYLDVPPQTKKIITLTYESHNTTPYDFPYDLIVQKQIGSKKIPITILFSSGNKTAIINSILDRDREFILK